MKYIFSLFVAFLLVSSIGAQTEIETSAFNGNITSVAPIGSGVYRVTISITDESGVTNGTQVTITEWVVWQSCKRYVITSISCGSCYLFNSEVTVEITDGDGNGAPVSGFVAVINETPGGLGTFTSGIQSGFQQCILNYYLKIIDNSIGGQKLFINSPGNTSVTNTIKRIEIDLATAGAAATISLAAASASPNEIEVVLYGATTSRKLTIDPNGIETINGLSKVEVYADRILLLKKTEANNWRLTF